MLDEAVLLTRRLRHQLEGRSKAMEPELDKTFKPAFLGRMVIIPIPDPGRSAQRHHRAKLDKVRCRI